MNVLFVYYLPSGGMDTLNRMRCKALREFGVYGHCLYYKWGAGLQNRDRTSDVHITDSDIAIKQLVDAGRYEAIVVTTDHKSLLRFRMLGYYGKLIYEIQGYGPKEDARQALTAASPVIEAHASALLNPRTPHIAAIFRELFPNKPQYHFNNGFDAAAFTYRPHHSLLTDASPIMAWLGRMEDNKNWREFLQIGYHLSVTYPNLRLWMFHDPLLADPEEWQSFERLVGELGLSGRLTVRSNVPHSEMPDCFSIIGDSGGFLCATSKVEGAPYAVLEAMSCRCPVLTTDSDGVSHSIIHNRTGKYYTLGDIAEALKEARELMENTELRERIRTEAMSFVHVEFSPLKYGQHFLQMLQTI
ncbi:glycosyltransferase family 4 protein [Paenibacillus sp. BC26]|uniref:glycosyltransferase family 4 protein n=1 Tax=Paenibacillus sp. BC26 TaxID=1881032 RepID=UPI0008DF7F2B|nr:glycosyltransferase [Paenibacillus sp. BC26]SFT29330.1 Glycosyl transferases group 1 [Paenibacillus sp. BC26]